MRRPLSDLDPAPRLIASSVVRGAKLHQSHGGLCIVDVGTGAVRLALDWNATDIDIEGRGGDRGLRGIGIAGDDVYVLSSVALLRFDRDLRLLAKYCNPYLKHCHELSIHNGTVDIVSTGFDAILRFDLATQRFYAALHLCLENGQLRVLAFDPGTSDGPAPANVFHLNSVTSTSEGLFFSGLRSGGLLRVAGDRLSRAASLPKGTHNAQPFRGGVLYNDTEGDRLCARFDGREVSMPVTVDPLIRRHWQEVDDARLARPLFARGLCPLSSRLVAAGSSPSTISLYDLEAEQLVGQVTLSSDVRNAIHGLAVWPYAD